MILFLGLYLCLYISNPRYKSFTCGLIIYMQFDIVGFLSCLISILASIEIILFSMWLILFLTSLDYNQSIDIWLMIY